MLIRAGDGNMYRGDLLPLAQADLFVGDTDPRYRAGRRYQMTTRASTVPSSESHMDSDTVSYLLNLSFVCKFYVFEVNGSNMYGEI